MNGESLQTIARRFLALAIPMALTNATVPLTGMIDVAMLGHLGAIEPMAGMGLATILFDFLYSAAGFLVFGTTAVTAEAVGRGDAHGVRLALVRSALLALGIGLAILLLALPIRDFGFPLLAGDASVKQAGQDYYDGRIGGAPAVLLNYAFFGWLVGRQKTRQVLALDVVANGANIAVNYFFLFHLGLGAFGAGLGNMLSQYLMTLLAIGLLVRERFEWRGFAGALDAAPLLRLLRLNRDIFVRTLSLMFAYALFTNLGASLGKLQLAANTVLLKLLETVAMCLDGPTLAVESLTAFFVSRGDQASLERLLRTAFTFMLGLGVLLIAIVALAGPRLFGLLTSHEEVVAEALAHRHWLFAMLLGVSVTYVFDGYLLGLHEGHVLRNCVLFSVVVCYLPAAAFAWQRGTNTALWTALVIFMAARVGYMAVAFRARVNA